MSSDGGRHVAMVTAMPFWRLGGGAYVRDIALVWYLGEASDLTVVYAGDHRPPDPGVVERLGLPMRFLNLTGDPPSSREQRTARLRTFLEEHPVDACLFDRIEPAYLLDAIPAGTKTFLDTHDVAGDPIDGLTTPEDRQRGQLDWDRELQIFRRFDRVIAIQSRDHRRIGEALGPERVILAPHPATLPIAARAPVARRLAFVASDWKYNVEALGWFLARVWPQLDDLDIELHLYGRICGFVDSRRLRRVHCHGFVLDMTSIYREADIVVNPLRRGSGLKIKTVEALSSGLPLVTTSEGARGLEHVAERCFLVADAPLDFANAVRRIVEDRSLRDRLAESAGAFAHEHLSPDACLGPLIEQVLE